MAALTRCSFSVVLVIFSFSCLNKTIVGSTRDLAALVESKGFSTFLRLLMQSGLKQILMVEGPFTLFAPTDEAFSALDEHVLENMFLQANERENILLHHIVSGLITSDQIINGTAVLTLGGNNITFSINVVNMTLIVKANDANLIDFDIKASNGVIHVVDQLLLPPFHDNRLAMLQTPQKEPEPLPNNIIEMAESIGLTSMTEYLADAGLALPLSMKGPYTLFIPSESAFKSLDPKFRDEMQKDGDLMRPFLLFHIVEGNYPSIGLSNDLFYKTMQGGYLRVNRFKTPAKMVEVVNGANIIKRDILGSNGVIHVIDKLLKAPDGDVIDVLGRDPHTSLFLDAVKESGLTEFLTTNSSFTVFVPTNRAFLDFNPKILERAMERKGLLSEIVLRHISLGINHGPLYSASLCWDTIITASNIKLRTGIGVNGTMRIGSPFGKSSLVEADILATNGVIHKINGVL